MTPQAFVRKRWHWIITIGRLCRTTLTWLTAELSTTETQQILCANPARLFNWMPSVVAVDR
ncbi:hypothetical protein ABZ379_35210 [Streptomyces canus]|uniref:hypothetical protein n=1 Tax=Streptomyces canus TaxID=58343 RepID=UPI0034016D8A